MSGVAFPELIKRLADCDFSQSNTHLCVWRDLLVADRELNETYKSALKIMETSKAVKRLRESQRAWIVFRDLNCLVMVGTRDSVGDLYPTLWNLCLASMTKDRAKQLKEILDCDGEPCPPKL